MLRFAQASPEVVPAASGDMMNYAGLITASLLLATGPPLAQPTPPPDFGFRFTASPCNSYTLDTFQNTYSQTMGRERPISIPLTLSPKQMAAIYEDIVKIDFFAYPTQFSGVVEEATERSTTSPSTTYHLEVRNAGVVHEVIWNDGEGPLTESAKRLSGLLKLIDGVLTSHPKVKRLPRAQVVCM
jgi:hypothetical protein